MTRPRLCVGNASYQLKRCTLWAGDLLVREVWGEISGSLCGVCVPAHLLMGVRSLPSAEGERDRSCHVALYGRPLEVPPSPELRAARAWL